MTADRNFDGMSNVPMCWNLTNVPSSLQCNYAMNHCDDYNSMGLLPYLTIAYCRLGGTVPAAVSLFFYLGFLFIFIGTAASDYFSPNISTLARLLRLSPEIAGATIVAFGNAASDLIGNIVSFKTSRSASLALGELLGAGLFLNCIVAGVINIMACSEEVPLRRSSAIRTIIFFTAGLLMVAVIIGQNTLYLWEGVYFFVCYALYVVVLLLMAHRKRINIGFGGLFRLPRPEAARVDDINPIITVIDTEKEQINDVHTDIDAESGKLSNRNNRACHPDSIQLHNRAMTQPPVNDMQQLELPRDNRRHFRLSSDHSPTARSFSFTTATNTKETISENVLNLHVAESVLESHRVTSLASAMELWGAWNILRSRGRMSTRSSSMGAHLPSSLLSPVSGTDARSLADNFLLQLPIDHRSASSRSPISERSRASSIYDIDSIVQVANATERGGPQQDGVALKRNASIISNRNQINIFTLVDNCPICFKCEVRGEHASAKENVKENMAPWHKSRRILRIVLYHYFPLLYTWEIQGFIGKFLGIINFIPVFLLSLSTPVIALFDEEEMSLSEECVDLDPQQYSVNQTKSSSTADNIANIVCIVQDCEHSNSSSREQSPSRTSRTSRLTSKAPSRTGKPASTPSTPRHTSPIDATRYVARDSAACPFGVCEVITWNHLPINFLQILFAPLLISFGLKFWDQDIYLIAPPNGSFSMKGWMIALLIGVLLSFIFAYLAWSGRRLIRIRKNRRANAEDTRKFCDNSECKYCAPRQALSNWSSFSRSIFTSSFWASLEYTPALSLIGFTIGLLWMYIVSSEIVAVLQALGVILNLSDGIMGLTVFAFGNSVGDFFTNIMLAKMGYYTMALSASWGAPMINLLITMGVALSFFLPENVMEEHFSPVLLCSACALVVVVMANLLLFGWHFKFKLNKGFGVFLIAFWITVMIINVILEIRISQ